jgi:hypothetical protein
LHAAGELLDQPRHVRIAAMASAKQKKADAEKERLAKLAKEKELAEAQAQLMGTAKQVYDANTPTWELLAEGKGDASESRRFGRKAELKLLVMAVHEMKALSAYA